MIAADSEVGVGSEMIAPVALADHPRQGNLLDQNLSAVEPLQLQLRLGLPESRSSSHSSLVGCWQMT